VEAILPLVVEEWVVVVVVGVVVVLVREAEVVVVVREVVVAVEEVDVAVVVVVVVLRVAFLVRGVSDWLALCWRLGTGGSGDLGEEGSARAACLCAAGLEIPLLLPLFSSCCVCSLLLWVVPVFPP
jgi:hypothetical protein